MKVAIISDTHNKIAKVYDNLLDKNIDIIIHLGDVCDDAMILSDLLNVEVINVKGNNDFYVAGGDYEKVIRLSGKNIFITHGHEYNVSYGVDELVKKSKSLNCDMCLYGHTHRYFNEKIDGIWVINPGSPTYPRDGQAGFLIYDTKNNETERILLWTY